MKDNIVEKLSSFRIDIKLTLLLFSSLLLYVFQGYYIHKTEFNYLFLSYSLLFIIAHKIFHLSLSNKQLYYVIFASIVFRFVLIFHSPNLSDDYFRFIWDGHCSLQGLSPYSYKPQELIAMGNTVYPLQEDLFYLLNSPQYYSIYPPTLQFFFHICAWISGGDIWWQSVSLKVIIFLLECGSIYGIWQLLLLWKKPVINSLLYALNPLCIIELVGNIHFEAAMIFFMVWSMYLLSHRKIMLSALSLGLAVGSKLWPLIFMPFLLRRIGITKTIYFGGVVIVFVLLSFIPYLSSVSDLGHIKNSMNLYFLSFEFNSSIWYVLRYIGFQYMGHHILYLVSPYLIGFILILLCLILLIERAPSNSNWWRACLFSFFVYLIFSTTVHPWYITPLVLFALFKPYYFSFYWAWLCWVSYWAYSNPSVLESLSLISLEYIIVFLVLIYELIFMPTKWVKNRI